MRHVCEFIVVIALFLSSVTRAATNPPGTVVFQVKVVDAKGQAVPDATVEQYQPDYQIPYQQGVEPKARTQTDANGSAELSASRSPSPIPMLILAHKPGLAPAWRQTSHVPGLEQRLVLTPPTVLAGVVVDETDAPVANAEVSVAIGFSETLLEGGRRYYNYLSGKLAQDLFRARSGTDGRFRIEGFPTNASADLVVQAPGKTVRQTRRDHVGPGTLQWRAGQEDIRLVVEPAGTIEGKIVTEEAGPALPITELWLQPEGPSHYALAPREPDRSAPDGSFRMMDVPAGSYRIAARFGTNTLPDWVAETVPVTVDKGEATRDVKLKAVRGGLLELAVLSKGDRKPIGGVNLNAYRQPNFGGGAVSSNNGVALLRVAPGEYQIGAYAPGWRTENTTASVETGQTNRIEIELAPAPRIRGVVRRPDGQPAAGLPVRIVGDHSMEQAAITTDADGKFETEWNPQRYGGHEQTFCLLIRDAELNLAVAEDIDEDTGALDLKLAPGLTFVGRVLCEGKPITNATASLVFWTGHSGMHLPGLNTRTNVLGQFEIPALPPGRKYGLQVSAPGFGHQYMNIGDTEEEAKRVELDTLELRLANLKLAGQVLDSDDKPVVGANVHLSGEGQPFGNVTSDQQGQFKFDNVCEGPVHVSANAGNFHGNVASEGGDTNVVVRLGEQMGNMHVRNAKPRTVKGVVIGPDDKPLVGANVTLVPSPFQSSRKTDTNGQFNLTWQPEPWQTESPLLVVRATAHDLAAVEDIFDDTTSLKVQLKPALTITGRVQGPNGTPLSNAQVGVWMFLGRNRMPIDQQMTPTDASGRFKITALPAEQDYSVYAQAKGHGQSEHPVTGGETNRIELEPFVLKLADRVVSGQVLNPNEKPAVGVHISYSGDDQPHGNTTTDSKGRFKIQVCEGAVRLFAGSQTGHADKSVEGGDTNLIIRLQAQDTGRGGRPRRPMLNGKALDLSSVGLHPQAVPAGRLALVCLMDVEQRASRRLLRLLIEQQESETHKDLTLLAVQAAGPGAEALEGWKKENDPPFAIGRVAEKSERTKWAHAIETLPWLILIDSEGLVFEEGFEFDELPDKLEEVRLMER